MATPDRLEATLVVATAVPAVAIATLVSAGNRKTTAARLRRWAAGVPPVALVVTIPLWLIVLLRGVFYPALGSNNLENSWGGPTLAGAWAVHLLMGIVALVVVSFVMAWWRPPASARPTR